MFEDCIFQVDFWDQRLGTYKSTEAFRVSRTPAHKGYKMSERTALGTDSEWTC